MALSVTEANAVQSKYFDKTMIQIAYEASPFWKMLVNRYKKKYPGGTAWTFPVRYKQLGRFRSISPREQLVFGSVQTRTQGEITPAYYEVDTLINWDERLQNKDEPKIVDLLRDRSSELMQDFHEGMATDVWTQSTAAYPLTAVPTMVGASDTYANIAAADIANGNWASVIDTTTTKVKIYGSGSISEAINLATFGDREPTDIFTTRQLYTKVEELAAARQQTTMADEGVRNLGVPNFKYLDKRFIKEPFMPTGDMYGLNMNEISLKVHPDADPYVSEWTDLMVAGRPQAMAKVLMWSGQLFTKTRDTHFKFTALVYTQ